ncbi:tetratricopeptide repeat protein [Abditibacterium utsteinense]|uniref:tetratricopeptide repeat protein n=1 Tax=Abditibacterium utsteinense TaxID=1960156 RepID=UPI000F460234|nr:tetratricopeptide repeat protein [Abditibacterium utsteinense]
MTTIPSQFRFSASFFRPSHSALSPWLRRGLLLSGSAGIALSGLNPARAAGAAPSAKRSPRQFLAPASVSVAPSGARIAIERARQLEEQGIPALAAVQFRSALDQAPQSLEAARELARFYGRQQRFEEAAEAWRHVIVLKRGAGDSEASIQLARAQSQLLTESDALPSSAGQRRVAADIRSANPSPFTNGRASQTEIAALTSTRSMAETSPRLAQNDDSAPLPPESAPLSDVPAPSVEAAPLPSASAPPVFDAAPPRPAVTSSKKSVRQAPATASARVPVPASRPVSVATPIAAIKFVNPAKVTPQVSRVTAAKAWPFVNRAAKELSAGRTQSALKLYQQAYKIDPTNAYAAPGVGTSYIALGRFSDAAATYRKYLAIKPGDAKALRGLADALTYGQKYREALGVNNAILSRAPRDFAASYQNGQIATYLRSYAQSDRFFNTALSLQPNNPEVRTAWAESLSYRRDPRAVANFQKALLLRPNSVRALTGLGNYYSYTGRFDLAIPRLRAALQAKPGDATLQTSLGNALTYNGEQSAAIPLYRAALQKQPNNRAARLGLGRALVYAGQSEAGAVQLQRVLRDEPGNTSALEALALAQADTSPSVAIESYQTLLSRQSDAPSRAKTLASIGDLRARSNEFPLAQEAYAQASRLAPADAKINLGYAQILASQEQFEAARPVVERVLSRQPGNAQALSLQVQIENKIGNVERAKELAAKLENIAPANVDEALSLAEALRATGNAASAKRVLERAVATAGDPASALRLADATRDAGDYAGASTLYNRILSSNPRNVAARLSYAETLIYQKDLAGAQVQVQQVKALDPANVQAKVLAATISLRADTPTSRDAAATQANEILAANPNNADARVIVGEVLTSRQKFSDAVAQFRGAVEAEPNNLEARLGLARNLNYSRDIEGSISQYRELLRRVPTETLPRLELAQIYLDRNRFSDAEALYNEVLALRGGLSANATARWKVETRAYAKLNPLAKINSPLRFSTKNQGKSRRVVVDAPARIVKTAAAPAKSRRSVYLAQNAVPGMGTIAPAAASGALPLPGATDGSDAASGAASTGNAPIDSDNTVTDNTAAPVMESPALAVPQTPDSGDLGTLTAPASPTAPTVGAADPNLTDQLVALRGLGEIRRRQERFGESLEFFNQALALDSTDSAARVGVAQALRGQTKYVEALQETDRVLATDTSNLPARVLRAQLLGDTGKPEQAQQDLDSLVSSLPENAPIDTYLTLTQAFNTLKNYPASLQLLDEAARVYPSEPAVPRLKAETLTFARRVPEAVAIYDQLISADPQDADAVLGKARVYNYDNQLGLSEPIYRQVLQIQPNNYQATTELADVLGRRANYAESIALYQSAIATNPADLATRVELARVQRYSGATGDAEATLNGVIENDPRYVSALVERGVLRGSQGSYAPGIADLNAARQIAPSDLSAQLGLAEVQSYAGNTAESIAGFRAVLARDPQNLRARTQLGLALSFANQTPEALKELDAAIVQNPGDVDARLAKADVLGRATRTAESVALYNQVLASDPQNIRARTGLADAYLYGRQYPSAVRVYDALIAANPTVSSYQIQRARALGYDGRAKEAVTALRAIVQREPDNLPARLALSEAGTNSGDQTLIRDAIADYRQILRTDSSNVPAQIGLSRALSYRGSYGEAKSTLNTVLASNPGNTEARLALADTQRFSGNSFGAQGNYNQVLGVQPNNASARTGLRAVRRETAPLVTLGGAYYNDSNGVRLRSVNVGGTYPTRAGTIGVIAERGRFSQGATERNRNALSLLLARNFGPVQARLILTRLKYDGAPNRTLYDLLLNNVRGPRERYYLGVARRDIFESDAAVAQGITATLYRAGFTYPLGAKFDIEGQLTRYRYSDSNNRTSIQPSIYYRFRPTNPSLRIGLGYFYDNTSELRNGPPFLYYTPQGFKATSILADYVVDQGDTRYGLFGAYPLTGATGNDGINRPAKTLFGFVNRDLNDALELFAQGGTVRAPAYHSNQVSGGVNFRY